MMRCACCGRKINPANAVTTSLDIFPKTKPGAWVVTKTYGPTCAKRLGYAKPATMPNGGPRTVAKRKSKAVISARTLPIQDGRIQLFETTA